MFGFDYEKVHKSARTITDTLEMAAGRELSGAEPGDAFLNETRHAEGNGLIWRNLATAQQVHDMER